MMGPVMVLLPHSSRGHQEGRHDLVLPRHDPNFSHITHAIGWIHLHNRAITLSSKRVRLILSTRLSWELAFTLQLPIQQTWTYYQSRHTQSSKLVTPSNFGNLNLTQIEEQMPFTFRNNAAAPYARSRLVATHAAEVNKMSHRMALTDYARIYATLHCQLSMNDTNNIMNNDVVTTILAHIMSPTE